MGLNISFLLNTMREARENRKLSQNRVAEALGISGATLSEMESGHIAVSFERWLHWCAVVKISPTDMLKQWERGNEFAEIDKERRKEYCDTANKMIEYGYGAMVEMVMQVFSNIVEETKRQRRMERSKREIKKYFPRVDRDA